MLVPVVLAGGAGTRLWPISRSERPKPFIPLADGRTLLEKTYRRVNGLSAFGDVLSKVGFLTVCNKEHHFLCADELEKAGQKHAVVSPVNETRLTVDLDCRIAVCYKTLQMTLGALDLLR